MKILKDAGKFEILAIMGGDGESALKLIEDAGRTAYRTEDSITDDSAKAFVKMIRNRGHEAVLEHSCMTVRFDDVCRGLTHEQVRHRLTGITQESTRYVDESEFEVVVPPHKDENERFSIATGPDGQMLSLSLAEWFQLNESMYKALRMNGWINQDARQVLPIAISSRIVITANLREWRHIFSMRCDKPAHWEIRRVQCNLLKEVQKRIPIIFDDFVKGGEDKNGLEYWVKQPRK